MSLCSVNMMLDGGMNESEKCQHWVEDGKIVVWKIMAVFRSASQFK